MLARLTRSLTKLALEVHWTSNLSEFPLRVAFARYALSAKAGRRANARNPLANVSKQRKNDNNCREITRRLWLKTAKTTTNAGLFTRQMFPKLCTNASAKSGFVALQFCSAEVASVALHQCFANGDYLLLVNFSINALQTLSIYCLKNTSIIATAHITSNTLTTNPSAA